MATIDTGHVIRRLEELRDWAEYIHESLTCDQGYESGKLSLLSDLAGDGDLRILRESSRDLAARLHALVERIPAVTFQRV